MPVANILVTALLLPLFLFPVGAYAGLFSSLDTFLQAPPEVYVADLHYHNAQSVSLLTAAIHSDPNPSKGGGDILIDDGALVPQRFADDTRAAPSFDGEISVYVVREGDTLSQIAAMFEVSPNTILWANDISDAGIITPGSRLVILPITGVRYVVREGDTLSQIAQRFDGDAEEILSYNQLASADQIQTGNVVIIPGGSAMDAPAAPRRAAPVRVTGTARTAASGFIHPLPGSLRTQGIHGYNAVDLAAAVGTPIRAAAAGDVIVAKGSGWNGGYGVYLVIRHDNGTQTLYAHNSRNAVPVGTRVAAGATVAYVGNTGRSTGPHLHFEVRGAQNPF